MSTHMIEFGEKILEVIPVGTHKIGFSERQLQ